MVDEFVSSDLALLDLLRQRDSMSVSELAECLDVTPTAVRQRLNRLMAQGYIDRSARKAPRGRPSHRYVLTAKGRRKAGANFADLAIALWQQIWETEDAEVRQRLRRRLAGRLALMYADQIEGETIQEKMQSVVELFGQRRIPFAVESRGDLPVLTALACPYPELAQEDRGVCAMERFLFSEILGAEVRLSQCRLDGETSCKFELREAETIC